MIKINIFQCAMLTLEGDVGQTEQSATALTTNTRSLRSRHNEKGLKPAASTRASDLLAGSSGINTASLRQQVSTRSTTRRDSESVLKRKAREMPALKSVSRPSNPKSSASEGNLQVHSKTQTAQDGDGSDHKKSQSLRSTSPLTSSPMSTRSRSGLSSSPEKSNRGTDISHGLPWLKKGTVTYQRKRVANKMQASDNLGSALCEQPRLLPAADVSGRERRKVDKIHAPEGSRSKRSSKSSSDEDVEYGNEMPTSPEKSVQDTDTSRGLPRPKTIGNLTKRVADKMRTRKGLRSATSSDASLSNADVSSRKRRGGPRKIQVPVGPNISSGEDVESGSGKDEMSPPKRRDIAVQADSQSSVSSPHVLHRSRLQSVSSSVASLPSRSRSRAVMESCSSRKTALTAVSSVQYDTAPSQPQVTDDTDDEELDRLARLAHGSPYSAAVPPSSDDETVTHGTPRRSCGSPLKRSSTTTAEQHRHLSTLSGENCSTIRARNIDTVADDTPDGLSDSNIAVMGKKRRTVIDKTEEKRHSAKSGKATGQLAADVDNTAVKSASGRDSVTAVSSSQLHRRVDHSVGSGEEVSSSRVENLAVEPVAGPSGIAPRTRSCKNASKMSG